MEIGATHTGKAVFDADHPVYALARQELTGVRTRIPGATDEDLTRAQAHTAALDAGYPGWTAEDHLEAGNLHQGRVLEGDTPDEASRAAANAHFCAESMHGQAEVAAHGKRIGGPDLEF